jgi:heme exporter protein CcmD
MNGSGFLSMSGYALYVWGSYGLGLLAMGLEVVLLVRRHKALRNQTQTLRHTHQEEI